MFLEDADQGDVSAGGAEITESIFAHDDKNLSPVLSLLSLQLSCSDSDAYASTGSSCNSVFLYL